MKRSRFKWTTGNPDFGYDKIITMWHYYAVGDCVSISAINKREWEWEYASKIALNAKWKNNLPYVGIASFCCLCVPGVG